MFFQGAMFIVFPNVPGAMFIQGATFIPESRVVNVCLKEDSFTYAISIKQGVGLFWKLRVSEIRVNQGVDVHVVLNKSEILVT